MTAMQFFFSVAAVFDHRWLALRLMTQALPSATIHITVQYNEHAHRPSPQPRSPHCRRTAPDASFPLLDARYKPQSCAGRPADWQNGRKRRDRPQR